MDVEIKGESLAKSLFLPSSVDKSTCGLCRGLGSVSQQPHGGLQLSLTESYGIRWPLLVC